MYKVNLDDLLALNSCQSEFQIGNSYDAWGKVARVVLNEDFIASGGLCQLGYGDMNPKAIELFKEITAAIGEPAWLRVMEINDRGAHKEALIEAVRLLTTHGVITLK